MIIIDPGHGGSDPGAIGPQGNKEKDIVLQIALLLSQMLIDFNIQTSLTRDQDRQLSLEARTALANRLQARLFISIHCNSFITSDAGGVEIWHSYRGDFGEVFYQEGQRIASIVLAETVKGTELRNRGTKTRLVDRKDSPLYGKDYFAVIRQVQCPSLLIELGFISNPLEEKLLANPFFQEKAARSLFHGLIRALFVDRIGEKSTIGPEMGKPTLVDFRGQELRGFILQGRSYVEVRRLAEIMGASVHWDPISYRVIIR